MSLELALLIDLLAVATCGVLLLAHPAMRLSHPGCIYWIFHVVVLSFRGWAVMGGAETFLSIDAASIGRFFVVADLFLVLATIGWIAVPASPPAHNSEDDTHGLRQWTLYVGAFALPVGVASLLATGYVPGSGQGSTVVTTSYQLVAILWPALILVAAIYTRGFTWVVLLPLSTYLAILAIQGNSRFRFILPLMMMLVIYLDRRGRRWPPLRVVALGLVAVAVFIPLKEVGQQIQAGDATIGSVVDTVTVSGSKAAEGENSEQALLDQGAITVRLVDDSQTVFHGRPYLALVTLAIPRPLWPEKPGLNDHIVQLSTPAFPVAELGAITTLPGDLYLNFGLWGAGVGALLFGIGTGRLHRWAYSHPRTSVARFAYVLFPAVLIQVSRDGLASLVLFSLVNSTPWLVIAWCARSRASGSQGHRRAKRFNREDAEDVRAGRR